MSKNTSNFSFNENKEKDVEEEVVEVKEEDKAEEYSDADQFMYDYDSAENKSTSSSLVDDKKKLIKIMMFVMGGGVLIILVIFIISLFSGSSYSYEDVELIMKEAAINYFDNNEKDLPVDETEISIIEVDTLVISEYMKPLDDYLSKGISCTGEVKVSMVGEDFFYKPFLDCGEDYISLTLYEKVEGGVVATSGYGLYQSGDISYYKGESVDNYVKLDNALWQILRVNGDNTISLAAVDSYGYSGVWDNRYNSSSGYTDGINDYAISRVKELSDQVFASNEDDSLLSENDKTNLVPFDLCIGKRDINSVGSDNSIECQYKLENQYIGLLTVSDFLNASADSGCVSLSDKACQNYNYLVVKYGYWLLTADSNSTNKVYVVDRSRIELASASNYSGYRYTITLGEDVMYKSGDGSFDDPYIIR